MDYKYNFSTGELGGIVTGLDEIKQKINKTILTAKGKYEIYTDYGIGIYGLLQKSRDVELIEQELKNELSEKILDIVGVTEIKSITVSASKRSIECNISVSTIYGLATEGLII